MDDNTVHTSMQALAAIATTDTTENNETRVQIQLAKKLYSVCALSFVVFTDCCIYI